MPKHILNNDKLSRVLWLSTFDHIFIGYYFRCKEEDPELLDGSISKTFRELLIEYGYDIGDWSPENAYSRLRKNKKIINNSRCQIT